MSESELTKEKILERLSSIIDPDLHISIVDLGLIYDVIIDPETKEVEVIMTLTSIACPAGPALQSAVEIRTSKTPGVAKSKVTLTFNPPWNPREHATEDGKMELGIID